MKNNVGLAVAIGALLLSVSTTTAQDSTPITTVGNWTIAYDSSIRGCFAVTSYNSGTILRFGYDGVDGNNPYYLMFGNPSWGSIEPGKDYELSLQLDRAAPWGVTAVGSMMGNLPVLILSGSNFDFLTEFTKKHLLTVHWGSRNIGGFSLKDTHRATAEISKCQLEIEDAITDPFASPPKEKPITRPSPKAADPFAI
ncbi:hypothetical protein JHL21_11340 [Devosia sp. WQ 349]|uniref:hypothetical protein n=1 Tax=Devosia sp. WQ 349K1 TaxID=2800329 RepID=UPI001905B4A6|nr:hypothetical protein [Devosia sp. WQ 349K1]MBK1795092.1 hypothetical protein [Devosia sp. WQ 349K1]